MTTTQLRDGSTTEDPRLGRLPAFDPASRQYQIRSFLAAPETSLRESRARYWRPAPVLDQLSEGQCVSEGCHGRRNGSPLRRKPMITDFAERYAFYEACQHRDWWPGCVKGHDGPAYGGTSVLAGMQEGQARGYWSEYRWIGAGSGTLENDVIDTLRTVGGIVLGIEWREGMYDTNPDGIVSVEGNVVGGHCIHAFAWVPRLRKPKSFKGTKPAIAWQNSWGSGYGVRGYGQDGIGFILLDDLLGILEADGEGAVPLA